MFRWLRAHYQYILFLVLSFAPFFWNVGIRTYTHIGGGDFSSPIDIQSELEKFIYTYDFNYSAGYDNSAVLSTLIPYYVIILFSSYLKFSPLISVLIFISFILFVSLCSMFDFLHWILVKKIQHKASAVKFCSILGAGLYGFSPYPIGLFAPGHFLYLVLYALFPWMLLFFIRILEEQRISGRDIFFLSLLFFSSVSFRNKHSKKEHANKNGNDWIFSPKKKSIGKKHD